jgi:hypothetical protein
MTIAAMPQDVPLGHPACTGYADLSLPVALNISGLVSACVSPAGYAPDEMVLYNLSDDVLDVGSAGHGQPALRPYYPVSDDLLPAGDEIETYAQNAAVQSLTPPQGMILLPVGGHIVATEDEPIHLAVQMDQYASAESYAAQLMTGYVVDNLIEDLPEDSALSYEASIADCVNGAHSLWQNLYQRPSADANATMQNALSTVPACQKLQAKVTADHAEEISAAAAENRLTDQALAEDLAKVADSAGEAGWESDLGKLAKAVATIAEDAH